MHISAVEEYGLRCALQLANLPSGSVLAASQVAEREGISVQYASKILHLFRKAGLVQASRGMQGGFRLVRPANEISLRAVFGAFREDSAEFCSQYTGQQPECVHRKECSVRPVFQVLAGYFDSVLEHLSLADLVRTEAETQARVSRFAGLEADKLRARFSSSVPAAPHPGFAPAAKNDFNLGSQE
jgi:Rrf2 family protein